MPTLKWIGKDKVINYHNEVPFRLLKENKSLSVNSNETENLLIKGDNLEALKALLPYYYNKIKVIYIDPPYNTGNEGWIYNDNVNAPEIKKWLGKVVGGEAEDLSRHDKWLCMMYPRLKLLRELLSEDGVFFVSIDDKEVSHLRLVMDEVFGEQNFLAIMTWRATHTVRNSSKDFNQNTEYVLAFANSKGTLIRAGDDKTYLRYPADKLGAYIYDDNDGNGPYKLDPLHSRNYYTPYEYKFKNGVIWKAPKGTYPRYSPQRLSVMEQNGQVVFEGDKLKKKDGAVIVHTGKTPLAKRYFKDVREGVPPSTLLPSELVGFSKDGTAEMMKIFGDKVFQQPKPTSLIKFLLGIHRKIDSDDYLVLDSFAGTGTTAHAVLALNKEDGGNRKFILVEMDANIAETITAERLKRVIQGYSYRKSNGETAEVEGLGGGFKFLELGNPLFDKHKHIIGEPSYEDLAGYIYFTETRCTIDWGKASRDDWYVGENSGIHHFIIYGDKSDLDDGFLEIARRYQGKKVVYAEAVMMDDDELERFNITFRQIPYEIRTF